MNVLYHHRTAGDRVERVHIMGIVGALRGLGHQVVIASPPGCDPELMSRVAAAGPIGSRASGEATGLRARLKRFARAAPPVFFEVAELLYNFYSLAVMLRLAHQAKPDLIYERTTANSVAPTWLAEVWRIPIVQEVNVTADVGRLRPLVLKRLTHALERWVFRCAAAQIAVSRRFKEMLIEAHLPGSEDAIVSPNAIDPAAFSHQATLPNLPAAFKPSGRRLIGYVGAFVPYHGVESLIDMAQRLRRPPAEWGWLLVGDGVMRPTVEQMIEAAGLRSSFYLTGAVRHEEVPGYVALMDICVMPRSNPHGSPMKVFEYMAMGKPVLAPRLGPLQEVIREGENGLLFNQDDPEEFAVKLRQLMDDAALRDRLGAQARRDAFAHHTWEANVRQLLDHLAARGWRLPGVTASAPGLACERPARNPA